MTNFKKIGLTALAGTLAATAYAQAGALSVSGTARMEYQSTQASASSKSDAFAQNTTISFTGSGELDNGMTVSYLQAQSGANTLTSQGVTLDMGDMGSVAITNYNFGGIGTIQDKVPNGGEQPWDDLGTHGTPEQGIASPHSGNRLGYKTTMGGATVSASMDYQQNSPTTSLAVSMPLMEGLEIGAGIATDQDSATTEQDIETMYATYSMGGISVGYQVTDVERTAANSDIERTAYGISFAVNDNLSVGYGVSDTEFEDSSLTLDEENTGIGIAYTSGGMKLGIINNTKDNSGGSAGAEEMTEFQLTFAF
jgi:outer membrane protein OmpU